MQLSIIRSKFRVPAAVAAVSMLTATLALGAFSTSANAEWRHEEHRGRDWDRHGWNGGYYRAPPVVYGYSQPYYYAPPPVVYGPGFGLNLNIR